MQTSESNLHACPCCGHRTLDAPSPSWLTCPVCYWTDRGTDDPSAANDLFEAQRSYLAIGASSPSWSGKVRAAAADDARDPDWLPMSGVAGGPSPRDQDGEAVIAAIREAFADVSPEGREPLRAAYRHDYDGEPDIDWDDDDTTWDAIPAHVLDFFGNGTTPFVFGNAHGFRYYMPAFMVRWLRINGTVIAVQALDLKLAPDGDPLELDEVKVLNDAQRRAVLAFLRHVVTYDERARWAQRALERIWSRVVGENP